MTNPKITLILIFFTAFLFIQNEIYSQTLYDVHFVSLNYVGRYRVDNLEWHNGKSKISVLPGDHWLDFGAGVGQSQIVFSVAQNGDVSVSQQTYAVTASNTGSTHLLTFNTTDVVIDKGFYNGLYSLSSFDLLLFGNDTKTFSLVKGVSYAIDNYNRVSGSYYYFAVSQSGNIVYSGSSARVTSNSMKFNTVKVKITPVNYSGQYKLGGYGLKSGEQTCTFIVDLVERVSISGFDEFIPGANSLSKYNLVVDGNQFTLSIVQ